ncbi:peptidase S49 [Chthoniobacter flavus Ellin428]|uniref:Peptidase S49 n=1 Tax=Chthoniobacter flavus Ellin428 TaxID=497964 RepID=B4CXQ9_9BACT|nr:peptidase S49 [Chthoniobacter flavus Ellin428]TCO88779.1 signal peptide peptidase SppA [Chthoniobacter flavus]
MTQLLHSLYHQPWLITPEAHAAMRRAARACDLFSDPPAEPPDSDLLQIENGIGIIPITGVLMKRPDIFSRVLLGAADMDEISEAINEAGDREDVQAVLLDIDSPGGTVTGTPELAAAVAALSRAKYVYAFSDGQMCSAAYWIASQADVIFSTPSARVGSIGVLLPMLDETEAFKQEGLKVDLFAAGKYKSVGVPGVALTDDQRTWLQSMIDEINGEFQAAVLARGRAIDPAAMEGQDFSGQKAFENSLTAGVMLDRATVLTKMQARHVS